MLKADVEDDPRWLYIEPDGTVRRDANVLITEAQYRQMAAGYLCPWCYQQLDHAFVRTCRDWCNGPRDAGEREWQAFMDERFGGVDWLGPSKATLARMENERDSRVWVPPSARKH